jgi:MFS family permease
MSQTLWWMAPGSGTRGLSRNRDTRFFQQEWLGAISKGRPAMKVSSANVEPAVARQALWRNRDYNLLWGGQVVSSVGAQASTIAFPLLLLALTHSPAQAGLASALRALPYVVFSLPAGALIDRWDRKRVMLVCDVLRAVALGSIPVALALGSLTTIQIYLISLIEGSLFVFFNVAEAASLPRIVSTEQIPAATAQNQATEALSSLVGPPIGGFLFGVAQSLPFLADAVSYAASVISLLFMRASFQGEHTAARRRLHEEIAEGMRWLWRNPLIRYMAFLTGVSNFVGNGAFLIAIVIAQQVQHASSFVIGLIFAIGGVGGVIGSVIAVPLQKRFSFGQIIITSAWVWALTTPLLAIAPNPLALGVIFAATFVTGPIYNVVQFGYRLTLIPDELQGRVNSAFRLVAFGGQPLGYALAGILLQLFGPVTSILLFSVPYALMAVLTTLNRHVREARPAGPPPSEAPGAAQV